MPRTCVKKLQRTPEEFEGQEPEEVLRRPAQILSDVVIVPETSLFVQAVLKKNTKQQLGGDTRETRRETYLPKESSRAHEWLFGYTTCL